jgi:hypothetical protein
VAWMLRYPYAAPNFLGALLLSLDAVVVWLCLRETAPNRRPWQDYGLKRGFSLRSRFGCLLGRRRDYATLRNIDNSYRRDPDDRESHVMASNGPVTEMFTKKTMHLRRIWGRNFQHLAPGQNVILTMKAGYRPYGRYFSRLHIVMQKIRPPCHSTSPAA